MKAADYFQVGDQTHSETHNENQRWRPRTGSCDSGPCCEVRAEGCQRSDIKGTGTGSETRGSAFVGAWI